MPPTTPARQNLISFLSARLPPQFSLAVDIDTLAALLIYQLVLIPEEVSVGLKGGNGVVAMDFEVGTSDRGRVIGKHGHIIKALRSLCRSIEKGRGQDVIVDLVGWEDRGWGDYDGEVGRGRG